MTLRFQKAWLIGLVWLSACLSTTFAQTDYSLLDNLYEGKRCFEFQAATAGLSTAPEVRSLFYRGAAAYFANDLPVSNLYLQRFLVESPIDELNLRRKTYGLLAANALRAGEYEKSSDYFAGLLGQFGGQLAPDEVTGYENILGLVRSLKNTPPPTAEIYADTYIEHPIPGDEWAVPVTSNGSTVNLIVDTGANFCLIAKSFADKLGVVYIDGGVEVGTVNSAVLRPEVGVLPEMKLGNATLKQTVFLVMDDESLLLPDGTTLTGVLGIPVLSVLKEVTFHRNGDLFIPREPGDSIGSPLCLDGLNLHFQAEVHGRKFPFQLDTGARTSLLYTPYFRTFQKEIEKKDKLTAHDVAGIGKSETVEVYRVEDFSLKLGAEVVKLCAVPVLTRSLAKNSESSFGNIGRDFMREFESLTLNFQRMKMSTGGGHRLPINAPPKPTGRDEFSMPQDFLKTR